MSPAVPSPSGDWLANKLASFQAQINALATQQNFTFTDRFGNTRMQLGYLPDGNFGVAIYNQSNNGGYVELNDPLVQATVAALTTTSMTFTTLVGSPTLPFSVGASGMCFVSIASIIGIGAGGQGIAMLYIDGSPAPSPGLQLDASCGAALQVTASNNTIVKGLTQGSHTLSLQYESVTGSSVTFSGPSITAIPY